MSDMILPKVIFKGKFKGQGCLRPGSEEGKYYFLDNGSHRARYQNPTHNIKWLCVKQVDGDSWSGSWAS